MKTRYMFLPVECVGRMLGRGASNLHDLEFDTKVRVSSRKSFHSRPSSGCRNRHYVRSAHPQFISMHMLSSFVDGERNSMLAFGGISAIAGD